MPLSTSSFENSLPELPWVKIFGSSLLIFFAVVSSMEIDLARLGFHPTVLDSPGRWEKERRRASDLGKKALILVGGSRIQLGVDLETLRKKTGLEPIQLAIDGSSFVPVLKGLADDPAVSGTIIIDYMPGSIYGATSGNYGSAKLWEESYERSLTRKKITFSLSEIENALNEGLHETLRSYADGADPMMSLQRRIFPQERSSQYLRTLPDRSRLADYGLVSMPSFYYRRVARDLGVGGQIDAAAPNAERLLKNKVASLQVADNREFIQGAQYLKQLITMIAAHGGKVYFVEMPSSGLVREADEKKYPRAGFLEKFEVETGSSVLVSADDLKLKLFTCPDGSHLDFRDRPKFTQEMADSLGFRNDK